MNEKDIEAFEAAYSKYSKSTVPDLAGPKWTGMKLFKAALEYRDGQQEPIKPRCRVNGSLPTGMCPQVIVGGEFCGKKDDCVYQDITQPVDPNVEELVEAVRKWKQIAEFQFAIRVYPDQLELGQGALDAWSKKWVSYEDAIQNRCAALKKHGDKS